MPGGASMSREGRGGGAPGGKEDGEGAPPKANGVKIDTSSGFRKWDEEHFEKLAKERAAKETEVAAGGQKLSDREIN